MRRSTFVRGVVAWTLVTFLAPAVIGGRATMSWWGALTAFFWAGLVRVALLHHVEDRKSVV